MSIKKYRFYLFVITLVIVIAGALSYFYFANQEESYRDGTLVQTDYRIEEELV